MFTFPGSFLNAGYAESDGIGHLFHDKSAVVGTKYLETLQHDDSVLFCLIHESREQRYGYDQFRHIVRIDLPTDEVARLVDHLRGGINPLNRSFTATDPDEGDSIAFCKYDDGSVGVGTLLNGKLMVLDLDEETVAQLVYLLRAYVSDYDDYIANQVDVTKPRAEWEGICEALRLSYDPHIAAHIEEALAGWTSHRKDLITVRLRDQHWADRVEEAANVEITADAKDWLAVLHEMLALRHAEIANEILEETGLAPFATDPYPYGVLPTTPLTVSLALRSAATVRHALAFLHLDNVPVLR